jgi:2',3'-cyclic-nucleotide 2'-phosphodiesterase (5'-nucleotidase family)
MKRNLQILLIISFVVCQLNTNAQKYVPAEVQYSYPQVAKQELTDSIALNFLKPYRDSMQKAMSKVIGFATVTLYQKQPECPLGNFLADAMKVMGEKKFGRSIDVALVNYGGSRAYIPKGEITLQNTFDLMPYDNLIILQEVKGSTLKKFLDYAVNKGGWSVSGARLQIKERKADSIYINGKLLDESATYIVANTDYVIRGGSDNQTLLKDIPQLSVGYLFRDAITEYIQQFTKQGKPVTAAIERRVVNADQ